MLTDTQQKLIEAIRDCLKHGHKTAARQEIALLKKRSYENIRISRHLGISYKQDKEFLRQLKRL